jgi:hypothetical protein
MRGNYFVLFLHYNKEIILFSNLYVPSMMSRIPLRTKVIFLKPWHLAADITYYY